MLKTFKIGRISAKELKIQTPVCLSAANLLIEFLHLSGKDRIFIFLKTNGRVKKQKTQSFIIDFLVCLEHVRVICWPRDWRRHLCYLSLLPIHKWVAMTLCYVTITAATGSHGNHAGASQVDRSFLVRCGLHPENHVHTQLTSVWEVEMKPAGWLASPWLSQWIVNSHCKVFIDVQ